MTFVPFLSLWPCPRWPRFDGKLFCSLCTCLYLCLLFFSISVLHPKYVLHLLILLSDVSLRSMSLRICIRCIRIKWCRWPISSHRTSSKPSEYNPSLNSFDWTHQHFLAATKPVRLLKEKWLFSDLCCPTIALHLHLNCCAKLNSSKFVQIPHCRLLTGKNISTEKDAVEVSLSTRTINDLSRRQNC